MESESNHHKKNPEAGAVVSVPNESHQQEVAIYKQLDLAKQSAEQVSAALAIYELKAGTLASVKSLRTGLPSLAILTKDTHAYDTTKQALNLKDRLQTLYKEYNNNILALLTQLESLDTAIGTLEQKFKMMIDDTSLQFDYKYFEQPLQRVMTVVSRISPEQFQGDLKSLLSDISQARNQLADLSTELPKGDSIEMKAAEGEKKHREATMKKEAVIKDKQDLEKGISRCDTLIGSYTDKISSLGEYIYKLKDQIDTIDEKIREYQDLKYKEAGAVTQKLNELRDLEHDQLKKQQDQLTKDKDSIRQKQQELLIQFEEQIAEAIKKLQVQQQAGQTSVDFHLIFVLDESGSLSNHFRDVESAFQDCISIRRKKSQNDVVSVIKFNSVGTIIYSRQPITGDFSQVKLSGGGTDFIAAFNQVLALLQGGGSNQQVPVVIFMTDGQDSRISASVALAEQIYKQFSQMMLFSIAFTDMVDMDQIRAITRAGNGGQLSRTSQGKTYQMVLSCRDKLQLVQAFQQVSDACNQLDDIKALIETLKDQRQKMLEDNKKATEEIYTLHEERILQQLQSSKNIQTKVTEINKNSHIDSLIAEEQQRKKEIEHKKKQLEDDETHLKEELANQEKLQAQLQSNLNNSLLAQRLKDSEDDLERIRKIFQEGKDNQTIAGYEVLSKEQLKEMNSSIDQLLSMAEDIKYEMIQMKTFVENTKDELENTEKILKDINLHLVKSDKLKEQGFYDIMIELRIFEETDIYPDGKEGKMNPKTVTENDLEKLYEQLLKQQIEKHPDLLEQLLEIVGQKEILLSFMQAQINTKINNENGNSTCFPTDSDFSQEQYQDNSEDLIKMRIYEQVDQSYFDLINEIKEKENEVRQIQRDIKNHGTEKFLEKNNISKEEAKDKILECREDLKNAQEELKGFKKEEREAVRRLAGPIKALQNAVQTLKHTVERKIQQKIEEKPRELLQYQYYIFKDSIHKNVLELADLLRKILNKQ